jgi:hypothetical protein
MKTILIIGGFAAIVPYAWDSISNAAFSGTQGNVTLPTFSGAQEILNWESSAAIIGFLVLVFAFFL